LWDVVAPWLRR